MGYVPNKKTDEAPSFVGECNFRLFFSSDFFSSLIKVCGGKCCRSRKQFLFSWADMSNYFLPLPSSFSYACVCVCQLFRVIASFGFKVTRIRAVSPTSTSCVQKEETRFIKLLFCQFSNPPSFSRTPVIITHQLHTIMSCFFKIIIRFCVRGSLAADVVQHVLKFEVNPINPPSSFHDFVFPSLISGRHVLHNSLP